MAIFHVKYTRSYVKPVNTNFYKSRFSEKMNHCTPTVHCSRRNSKLLQSLNVRIFFFFYFLSQRLDKGYPEFKTYFWILSQSENPWHGFLVFVHNSRHFCKLSDEVICLHSFLFLINPLRLRTTVLWYLQTIKKKAIRGSEGHQTMQLWGPSRCCSLKITIKSAEPALSKPVWSCWSGRVWVG